MKGFCPPLFRSDDKFTVQIRPAENNERRRLDIQFTGKFFDYLVDDIAVFEPDHKNPSRSGLRIFHQESCLEILKLILKLMDKQ